MFGAKKYLLGPGTPTGKAPQTVTRQVKLVGTSEKVAYVESVVFVVHYCFHFEGEAFKKLICNKTQVGCWLPQMSGFIKKKIQNVYFNLSKEKNMYLIV